MDKALWSQVQPLLDKAIDMPAEERTAWLARLRDESPTIADELQRLLAREGTLDRRGFLDTPTSLDSLVGKMLDGTATALQRSELERALAPGYELQAEVGRGGMATVFRAHDTRHGRDVAIKVIRPDAASVLGAERFLAEIRLTANLTHPNILPLLDSGQAGGALFYVMPFIEGETLRARMRREGALPVDDVRRVLRSVLEALAHAHEKGLVHRDIKPDNVLLAGRQAWVADFGIAKAVASSGTSAHAATSVGVALGSPGYMAPEQIEGSAAIDARTDLYAVGAMAWEMLAGRPVFTGESMQQLFMKHLTAVPEDLRTVRPEVPPSLADAVMRCLQKAPERRPHTAADVVAVLDTMDAASGPHPTMRRNPWPRRLAGGAALTVVAIVGVMLQKLATTSETPELRQVTTASNVVAFATSPTTGEIVYAADEEDSVRVWSARRDDALPRLVASRVRREADRGVDYLAWSPDGTQLLLGGFIESQSRSMIKSASGDRPAPYWFSRWSPDSRSLAGWQPLWKGVSHAQIGTAGSSKFVPFRSTWTYLHDVAWDPTDPVFWLATATDTAGRYQVWSLAHADSIPHEVFSDTLPLGSLVFNGRDLYFARAAGGLVDILKIADAAHGRAARVSEVARGIEMGPMALLDPWFKGRLFEIADSGRRISYLKSITRSTAHVFERADAGWRRLWQSPASTAAWDAPRLSRDGSMLYRFESAGDSSSLVMTSLATLSSTVAFRRTGAAFAPHLSPNRQLLVFCEEVRGRTQLHVLTLATRTSRVVSTTATLGSSCDTEWLDEQTLLVTGDRNQVFTRIDVEKGEVLPFDMGPQVPGFLISPRLSGDGRWVAFAWNRWETARPDLGTWRVRADGSGGLERMQGAVYPTGWRADGVVLGMKAGAARTLTTASVGGGASTTVTLPVECKDDNLPRTNDAGTRLLCVQATTLADVWEATVRR